MPAYVPCDCGQRGCFECAVTFVISDLGFPLHCQCFSSARQPRCGNRCQQMRPDWRSAFERSSLTTWEWAHRRLSQRGASLVTAMPLNDDFERDTVESCTRERRYGSENSKLVIRKFDIGVAASRLCGEVADDPISFDAARLLVARCIRDRVEIPESLRDWAAEVVTGKVSRPKSKGKTRGATDARDKMIFQLVKDLHEYCGLSPTAADRTEGKSACHAVAEGFRLLGLNRAATRRL